jgi:hypothetical protein
MKKPKLRMQSTHEQFPPQLSPEFRLMLRCERSAIRLEGGSPSMINVAKLRFTIAPSAAIPLLTLIIPFIIMVLGPSHVSLNDDGPVLVAVRAMRKGELAMRLGGEKCKRCR